MSQDSTREHEHEVNHGHHHDGDDHDGHLKIDVTVRTPAGISLEFDVRQRWQTKRGYPGQQHITDWMTLDLSGSFFPLSKRDNFGNNFVAVGAQACSFIIFLLRMGQTGDNDGMVPAEMANHVERANFSATIGRKWKPMADEKYSHRPSTPAATISVTSGWPLPSIKIWHHNSRLISANK